MMKVTFGRFTRDGYLGPSGGFIECRVGSLVFADINLRKVEGSWRATFQVIDFTLAHVSGLKFYNGASFMTHTSKRSLVRSVKDLARAEFH